MTILLSNQDIAQVLTAQMTRDALRTAYRELAQGEGVCRPRIDIRIPTSVPGRIYQWGSMEGGSTAGYFAVRIKSDVVYEEQTNGIRTQEKFAGRPGLFCGLILLTSIETGEPLALINDGYLQHMRVAADSAIGADLLARTDCRVLGMLGAGGMARAHVESLLAVRDIERLQVYSPTLQHRQQFGAEMAQKYGLEVAVMAQPEDACRGADILASCTDSTLPVIRAAWLEPGMHVIAVGGQPEADAVARFDIMLRLGTAPAPVGRPELGTADEYLGYLARPDDPAWAGIKAGRGAAGVHGKRHDVLLADLLDDPAAGRSAAWQITHSERGNIQGAQFYAVAGAAYEAARRLGLGKELPTELFLQDIRD